jgi:ABC-type Fe3+/spermidine/putrescine transport system ATPase subunit
VSAYLSLRGLSRRFGPTAAVDGLSLDVRRGEMLFLLGPSGCGKSTTLRLVAGYERPDAGRVVLAGRDLGPVAVHHRNIGMVFQDYALFPHRTVIENVAFGLAMRGVPPAERRARARAALAQVELVGLDARYPSQLSGGQRQRVALARAIVIEPDLLLLDEPLASLDRRLRDAVRLELRALQRRLGITTVAVTHDQDEALALGDRVAVMAAGRLVQVGSPAEVYNGPATGFVAAFLGDASRFSGRAESPAGDWLRVATEQGPRLRVRPTGEVAAGDRVELFLRPERVAIAARGGEAAPLEAEAFDGIVETAAFHGADTSYHVRLGAGGTVVARRPAPDSGPDLAPGARVTVWWDPTRVTVVKDSTGPAPAAA